MKLGSHQSVETRAKISAGLIGNTRALGHRLSENTKDIISAKLMGNTCALGHHCSEGTRTRMSVAQTGHPPWNKGVSPSDEARAKMSASHKGVPLSPETRKRMSEVQWKGGRSVALKKNKAKRRSLGFHPLNEWFVGSEGHHTNQTPGDVIYVPMAMHDGVSHDIWTGRGMAKMNAIAYSYLSEQGIVVTLEQMNRQCAGGQNGRTNGTVNQPN